MVNLDQRIMWLDDSRHASDVRPLARKVIGKGDGNREGSDVSGRRIDREAVGSTTCFGRIATATHVTRGIVGVLHGARDQVIAALEMF